MTYTVSNLPKKYNFHTINAIKDSASRSGVVGKRLKLTHKTQLNKIITSFNGSPDLLAINIYWDTLRSQYVSKKSDFNKSSRGIVGVEGSEQRFIYSNYAVLTKIHGYSSESIRLKLAKLEKLGLISRSFEQRNALNKSTPNQLIIYLWKDTPHFIFQLGSNRDKVTNLKRYTSYNHLTNSSGIDSSPPKESPQDNGGDNA